MRKRSLRSPSVHIVLILTLGLFVLQSLTANAQQASVDLGTAQSFAVLAGQGVTNTGFTVVTGDLGTHPNPAVTNFPPGIVNGAVHQADAVALQAQTDLTDAYAEAAAQTPVTTIDTELGGETLNPGVYDSLSGTFEISVGQTLTLDALGDPDGEFIFKIATTLVTFDSTDVSLIGNASACNVWWQVGSSATLGTNSNFAGNVKALTSSRSRPTPSSRAACWPGTLRSPWTTPTSTPRHASSQHRVPARQRVPHRHRVLAGRGRPLRRRSPGSRPVARKPVRGDRWHGSCCALRSRWCIARGGGSDLHDAAVP